MTEYSRMAKGHYPVPGVSPSNAKVIYLPFAPDYVELLNYTAATTPAQNGVPFAKWDADMGQGGGVIEAFNATPVLTTDIVTSGGISTFTAGLQFQFGASQSVGGITKADPAIVTVTGHGYTSGDVVIFQNLYQTAVTGMRQIDGIPFTITVINANSFSIPWNTNQSNYTAITGAATGSSTGLPTVKKVLYPFLYFPGVAVISAIDVNTPAGFTTIHTASAHNFVVGQEVAFRIPPEYGTIQLNSLPNNVIPGSPIYGFVVTVTDYNTVVVNINSAGYTAFTNNQAFLDMTGQTFPQIVAVGDVNTGGVELTPGSQLYPPPYSVPIGTTRVNTINGPAIKGAFVNNTRQGFIVGSGAGVTLTSAFIGGTEGDVIYWRAFLHDMNVV